MDACLLGKLEIEIASSIVASGFSGSFEFEEIGNRITTATNFARRITGKRVAFYANYFRRNKRARNNFQNSGSCFRVLSFYRLMEIENKTRPVNSSRLMNFINKLTYIVRPP